MRSQVSWVVSFIQKSKHRDEKNITNPIPVFKELVQDQVKKKGVATKVLVIKVILQGILWQSEQSNLALLRIKSLIFVDILGPMCS